MSARSSLVIGTLGRPHGVRGAVRVRCSADGAGVLRRIAASDGAIELRLSGDVVRSVRLRGVRGADASLIVDLDGVASRDDAEALVGADVAVERDLLPPLDDDEYFLGDLAGCTVIAAESGTSIGRVRRAESLPANVVLTIDLDAGGSLLAPLVDDAVPDVDLDARTVTVDTHFLGYDAGSGSS